MTASSRYSVIRVQPDQWRAWRDTRLRALADSPSAFAVPLEVEQEYDDELWIGRCEVGSAGNDSAQFAAVSVVEPDAFVGMVGVITSAVTEHCPPGEAQLVSMWTAPESRGHGVGQALVKACVDWTRATNGLGALSLWVTRGNEPAERLYQRCGFEFTGDHEPLPSDPCKDEVRMKHPF